jgi:hypothetical protein
MARWTRIEFFIGFPISERACTVRPEAAVEDDDQAEERTLDHAERPEEERLRRRCLHELGRDRYAGWLTEAKHGIAETDGKEDGPEDYERSHGCLLGNRVGPLVFDHLGDPPLRLVDQKDPGQERDLDDPGGSELDRKPEEHHLDKGHDADRQIERIPRHPVDSCRNLSGLDIKPYLPGSGGRRPNRDLIPRRPRAAIESINRSAPILPRTAVLRRFPHRSEGFSPQVLYDVSIDGLCIVRHVHDIGRSMHMAIRLSKDGWCLTTVMDRCSTHGESRECQSFGIDSHGEFHEGFSWSSGSVAVPVTGVVTGEPGCINGNRGDIRTGRERHPGTLVDQDRKKA